MLFVSIISSQEWIRLRDAAQQQFPGEGLARGEMMRRFSLSGVAALKAASDAERGRRSGNIRRMWVAGPEADKPRTSWDVGANERLKHV